MRNIGNVYAYFIVSIVQLLKGNSVIEIFSVKRVDGKGLYIAEITSFLNLISGYLFGDLICLCFYFGREGLGEAEICQDGVHFRFILSFFTEHTLYVSDRLFGILWPFHNPYNSFFAVFRPV